MSMFSCQTIKNQAQSSNNSSDIVVFDAFIASTVAALWRDKSLGLSQTSGILPCPQSTVHYRRTRSLRYGRDDRRSQGFNIDIAYRPYEPQPDKWASPIEK